ncbi:MAG: hypothetical protein PUC64_00720 [Clostridium sp.]|nr:hypothetical protein [Clostridium sp.]
MAEEIFKTIETVGLSYLGKTAEVLLNVVKAGTLELIAVEISKMDAAVLSAKKERMLDGQAKSAYTECRIRNGWISLGECSKKLLRLNGAAPY